MSLSDLSKLPFAEQMVYLETLSREELIKFAIMACSLGEYFEEMEENYE